MAKISKNLGRDPYVKIFKVQDNVDTAVKMIKDGWSDNRIAKQFHCDRTSVLSLRKRLSHGWKLKDKKQGRPTLAAGGKFIVTDLRVGYKLTMIEWDVLEMYHGIGDSPLSFDEIAVHFGVPKKEIQKIELSGRMKIKDFEDKKFKKNSYKKTYMVRHDELGRKLNAGKNYSQYFKDYSEKMKKPKKESRDRAIDSIKSARETSIIDKRAGKGWIYKPLNNKQ